MDKYIGRNNFELIETDTDSIYFALAFSNLQKLIKPGYKEKYDKRFKDFWFPRTCCKNHSLYDLPTPGLFKLEFEGNEMVGLCSKTYIISNTKLVIQQKILNSKPIPLLQKVSRQSHLNSN
ncbi:hypothetical protein KUTeg_022445 [Tegillarca granosa]|uniref:DNA-directed DNA polymerase n=1 Tax=Tegillarca granosa TaxID=220873 RepID=A0ABQ9EAT8_TEGGR|nr:hypothetical protein KUTeg_022445 [Tegillarca granosa]